jgi:2-(3-amino-3-carboxypropyl)histidine synthase
MEDDRAATNLGPEADQGMPEEAVPVQKQPRRRFVGRKTAEKTSDQQADPNANIEDSSAIQGVRGPYQVGALSGIANIPKSLNLAVPLVP